MFGGREFDVMVNGSVVDVVKAVDDIMKEGGFQVCIPFDRFTMSVEYKCGRVLAGIFTMPWSKNKNVQVDISIKFIQMGDKVMVKIGDPDRFGEILNFSVTWRQMNSVTAIFGEVQDLLRAGLAKRKML
ncbi:MAG: hypothetical protein FWB74_03595 [Defluviitaleaceae bacterium]|nr:hypothetical protein [Defluviitaleaceae bacterium]